MTKSEICRRLAEALEPKPFHTRQNTWGHHNSEEMRRFRSYGYQEKVKGTWEDLLSPKGFWVYSLALDAWFPVDFFTDESANARLLESMPDPILCRMADGWGCCHLCTSNDWYGMAARDPRRTNAVVLAACKQHGIEVGEIE